MRLSVSDIYFDIHNLTEMIMNSFYKVGKLFIYGSLSVKKSDKLIHIKILLKCYWLYFMLPVAICLLGKSAGIK